MLYNRSLSLIKLFKGGCSILTTQQDFQEKDKYLFYILCVLNFFPFYIGLSYFLVLFFYLSLRGKIRFHYLYHNPMTRWFSLFSIYSLGTSLIHQNIYGIAVSFVYFIFILYFAYYEKNAPPDIFDTLVNISMVASAFIFIYVIFEHLEIVAEWDYSFIASGINKNHSERVEATFFNPNYFALMLEFFIAMGLYKLFTSKTTWKKIIYSVLIVGNILATLYTGNRTSPIVVVASILVFFYVLSYRKVALLLTSILGISLIWFVISGYYPRIDSLAWALYDRFDIWETGLKGIQDNWVFGQGPYTYMQIYDLYDGKFTYHAHSIFIDTLLNYGIFGTSILLITAYNYLKWLIRMHKYPLLKRKAALVWSMLTIFIVHGITDLAIYWFQTSFVFLTLILLVPSLVKAEESKEIE